LDHCQLLLVLIGTFDSKGEEHAFLRERIIEVFRQSKRGVRLLTVNVGTQASTLLFPVDYEAQQVAQAIGARLDGLDRGEAMKTMTEAAAKFIRNLFEQTKFHGIVGCGGSGGTTVITAAMRTLPFHVAKVCLSTTAGGDVSLSVAGSNHHYGTIHRRHRWP
jgi:uncharacterized protein (UPF0261 family)